MLPFALNVILYKILRNKEKSALLPQAKTNNNKEVVNEHSPLRLEYHTKHIFSMIRRSARSTDRKKAKICSSSLLEGP